MDKKLKIALAQLNPLVGDVSGNIEKLISIRSNLNNDVDILVAPELYVSGYPIDDLVLREDFLNLVESEINKLVQCTKDIKSAIFVGAPRKDNNQIKHDQLIRYIGKLDPITLKNVIRSFSKYFALVNVAEEAYQHINRTDRLKSGFDSWEGSFDQTLRECKASEMDDTQLENLINR